MPGRRRTVCPGSGRRHRKQNALWTGRSAAGLDRSEGRGAYYYYCYCSDNRRVVGRIEKGNQTPGRKVKTLVLCREKALFLIYRNWFFFFPLVCTHKGAKFARNSENKCVQLCRGWANPVSHNRDVCTNRCLVSVRGSYLILRNNENVRLIGAVLDNR